mmetsp:Transcript_8179/g.17330  ORF Transcript_8179/g.17330 Transcript_8179/m.17330 type:complete len:266 (+) Transcript_8179:69-866(+)|eukprot:CAMPEP_0180629702 /NCGR_PEP_ID=MMETSP1037_2-20121125/39599_1 /TAXON_ID=632150 /ORGANISM="Azadinium spinosum, Strain 3D9" /LENGTH=265 /DNA_ID=CAMNT_0022650515 /DNA_START=30 /DNA_END=827 /DNA_ORIENTATION=-
MRTYGSTAPADSSHEVGILQESYGRLSVSAGLALITGYLDAVFFIRYKAYASLMTGNMLMLGFSLANLILRRCGNKTPDPDSAWIQTFPPPYLYAVIISMFLFGSFMHRILVNKRQWTVSTFGPLVVLWFVAHELIHFFIYGKEIHSTWNMLFLAPICGIIDSVAMSSCIDNLPHCSTTNLAHIGHTLANAMTDKVTRHDVEKCVTEVCMLVALILGACGGFILDGATPLSWDFELSVLSIFLAMLYYVHDNVVFVKPKPLPPAV